MVESVPEEPGQRNWTATELGSYHWIGIALPLNSVPPLYIRYLLHMTVLTRAQRRLRDGAASVNDESRCHPQSPSGGGINRELRSHAVPRPDTSRLRHLAP